MTASVGDAPYPTQPVWPEEDRLDLARELHDVVSHSIAAISLQAGVGLHLLADAPEQAAGALQAIRSTSHEALDELRAILTRLVEPESERAADERPLAARLACLAERTTAAGVPTRLSVTGALRPLPSALSQSLFRIVQESLTNVLRHSGATSASVSVAYGDEIVVEVSDDGRGTGAGRSTGSGLGIPGMRARLEALGGSLDAGPSDGSGFCVRAAVAVGGAR
jgi:signal transduction histidine kinase